MTTTAFETEKKPGGVSEACLYSEHEGCRSVNCQCSCHVAPNPNIPIPTVAAGPEKACPKCGSKRPFSETFCRVDGERLASLLCGVCGSGMNVEDSYCYNCGGPKGTVKTAASAPIRPNLTVPDLDNLERDVLKGLQEELSVQSSDEVDGNKRVVEQPMGTQGSFKLVSSPSPNRIRKPASEPGARPPIRLPIKPS